MTILYATLFIAYTFALFSRCIARPALAGPGPDFVSPNKLMAFIPAVIIILISGLRQNIGDTYFYKHAYELNDFDWAYVSSSSDIGFALLQMILKQISKDPQILVFTTALITNLLIVAVLYKYCRLFELGLYVYITSGMFIVSMNGIRQFLAAAIIFAATKYLFDGSWKKFVIVVLLASTIHSSALLLIPIYFMARRKAWTGSTILLLAASILLVAGYNQFSSVLFAAIENTQYGHYQDFQEGGANIIRVIIHAIPVIIAYVGRDRLREIFPKSDYIVNMSLLGLLVMIIATQNWIFARFHIYFGLYSLILISWMIKLFAEKQQKLVYLLVLCFYFLYFFYENAIALGIVYRSPYFG